MNLGEGRHSLAREVFHGKRGELFQRYREGQEDQLSALGLVVNMIVLWNTLYMDAILTQLRSEGYQVRPEDEARLSPFGHEHINMLGRYSFSIPEAVARGELRPLNGSREEEGPMKFGDYQEANVKYQYKIDGLADWAKTPARKSSSTS